MNKRTVGSGKRPLDVYRNKILKRQKNVSGIQDKVLSMYARGMSQRDTAETIEDIYWFEISHETVSQITDQVLEQLQEWQNRPLKKLYTFLSVGSRVCLQLPSDSTSR